LRYFLEQQSVQGMQERKHTVERTTGSPKSGCWPWGFVYTLTRPISSHILANSLSKFNCKQGIVSVTMAWNIHNTNNQGAYGSFMNGKKHMKDGTYLHIAADHKWIRLPSKIIHIINTNNINLIVYINTLDILPVSFNDINEIIHSCILTE
jgi:hypothetical protein